MELTLTQQSILRISDEKTMQLVELYAKEQCLWNTSLDSYKSRAKRSAAAERIAKVLNVPNFTSRFVVIKFKNLRNSYCQELRKVENSVTAGEDPPYRPRVFWFKKMDSFLRPYLHRGCKEAMRHLEPETEILIKREPQEELVNTSNDAFYDDNNDYNDNTDTDDDNQSLMKQSGKPPSPKRPRTEDPLSDTTELIPLVRNISSQLHDMANQRDDCFDSFGKYVSAMLRNMPPQKAMEMQPKIVNLLVSGALTNNDRLISQSHEGNF